MSVPGISCANHGGGSSASGDPPLLLLHGAGGDRHYWPPQLRRMAAQHVLAPDLPGHGESAGPSEGTIPSYLTRLLGWLDQLGFERLVWCGHSMGGAIALQAGRSQPDRVAGLILISTGARLRVHPQILKLTAEADDPDATVRWLMDYAFSHNAPEALIRLASERLRAVSSEVLHQDFLACDGFDLTGQLASITAPTLVITGDLDRLTPPKYARYLATHLPNASLRSIAGAGHMVMLERPGEVAQMVRTFLREV